MEVERHQKSKPPLASEMSARYYHIVLLSMFSGVFFRSRTNGPGVAST